MNEISMLNKFLLLNICFKNLVISTPTRVVVWSTGISGVVGIFSTTKFDHVGSFLGFSFDGFGSRTACDGDGPEMWRLWRTVGVDETPLIACVIPPTGEPNNLIGQPFHPTAARCDLRIQKKKRKWNSRTRSKTSNNKQKKTIGKT